MGEEVSEELRERFRNASRLIRVHRGDKARDFNESARLTIEQVREAIPSLDEDGLFTVFSSVAHMLSVLMICPTGTISDQIESLFDTYTLAASSMIGLVDLNDDGPPESEKDIEKEAMAAEILRLRGLLEGDDAEGDNGTGMYL